MDRTLDELRASPGSDAPPDSAGSGAARTESAGGGAARPESLPAAKDAPWTNPVDVRGRRGFDELLADRKGLLEATRYPAQVEAIVAAMVRAFSGGHKVLWFGNGGSAADAQHLAAEFSGRFLRDRRGLHSESLSVNTSALTAISNDFGYEHVFERQMESFAQPGDVVVGITTSGSSRNIVLALEEAKRRGAVTVAFTGNGGGAVAAIADLALVGPDGYSAIIQEVHITLGHIICDLVEQALIFKS